MCLERGKLSIQSALFEHKDQNVTVESGKAVLEGAVYMLERTPSAEVNRSSRWELLERASLWLKRAVQLEALDSFLWRFISPWSCFNMFNS
jgi:hypothetical protein